MRKILTLAAFLVFVGSFANAQEAATAQDKQIVQVEWKGKTYRSGDRVKVISFSGTMKPKETGYSEEVSSDAGKTGTILRGMKREATSYFKPDPNEPIQIVLVKWDAQNWKTDSGKIVSLKPFEATIHVEYLEVSPKTATAKVEANVKSAPKVKVRRRRP